MRFQWLFVCLAVFALADQTQAQYGYGYAPGMSSCPYSYSAASGAYDDLDQHQDEMTELKDKLSEYKDDLKGIEEDLSDVMEDLGESVNEKYLAAVIDHIKNQRSCGEYSAFIAKDGERPRPFTQPGDVDGTGGDGWKRGEVQCGIGDVDWQKICSSEADGQVRSIVCSPPYGKTGSKTNCVSDLNTLATKLKAKTDKENQIRETEKQITQKKRDINRDKRNIKREQKEDMKTATEASACPQCAAYRRARDPSTMDVLGNVALGIASIAGGAYLNKQAMEINAGNGYEVQPTPAALYGFPFMLNALYGAVPGGIGAGGFACSGTVGGGGYLNGVAGVNNPLGVGNLYGGLTGAFGYPNSILGGQVGGGLFNGGLGPWGVNNPYALVQNQGGLGLNLGLNGGLPFGQAGLTGGLDPLSLAALQGGGLTGGFLGGGVGLNGLGSLNGLGNGLGNLNGLGGLNGLGSIEMQQQMMQSQMQQYQAYIDLQRRQQENLLARQRVISGLQTELYSLVTRLQQAQSGLGFGLDGGASFNYGANGGISSGVPSVGTFPASPGVGGGLPNSGTGVPNIR